jgi:hypothetical protein
MQVPSEPPPEPEPEMDEDALYALADAEVEAARKSPANDAMHVPRVAPVAAVSGAGSARTIPRGAAPLAYQRGPTERERERFSSKTLVDIKRDLYVPLALIIAGMLLQVVFYLTRYQLSGTGIAVTTFGLSLITAFKAALLIGFALVTAGPLGVSFGGVWSCVLKLAALAAFSDGLTTWVEYGMDKLGAGGMGYMVSFPVALATYWLLLIYLFSMDAGDSWMVVVILSVFDYIVRTVLLLLLLKAILGWGGVSPAAISVPGFGAGGAPNVDLSNASPAVQRYVEAKEEGKLEEARKFIAGGRQAVLAKPVDDWYAAGAKNVWFVVGRDVEFKPVPQCVIIEMPKESDKRAKCLEILKAYYEAAQIPTGDGDEEDEESAGDTGKPFADDGEPYRIVPIR